MATEWRWPSCDAGAAETPSGRASPLAPPVAEQTHDIKHNAIAHGEISRGFRFFPSAAHDRALPVAGSPCLRAGGLPPSPRSAPSPCVIRQTQPPTLPTTASPSASMKLSATKLEGPAPVRASFFPLSSFLSRDKRTGAAGQGREDVTRRGQPACSCTESLTGQTFWPAPTHSGITLKIKGPLELAKFLTREAWTTTTTWTTHRSGSMLTPRPMWYCGRSKVPPQTASKGSS